MESEESQNNIYKFNFEEIQIAEHILESLQKPLDFLPTTIKSSNTNFAKEFPFVHIPISGLRELIKEKKIAETLGEYKDEKKRLSDKEYIAIQMQHQQASSKFDVSQRALVYR